MLAHITRTVLFVMSVDLVGHVSLLQEEHGQFRAL